MRHYHALCLHTAPRINRVSPRGKELDGICTRSASNRYRPWLRLLMHILYLGRHICIKAWARVYPSLRKEDYRYQYLRSIKVPSPHVGFHFSYLLSSELSNLSSTAAQSNLPPLSPHLSHPPSAFLPASSPPPPPPPPPTAVNMVRGNLRGGTLRGAIAFCCGAAFLVDIPSPLPMLLNV